MVAVDTNVLSTLLTGREANSARAAEVLRAADELVVCPVVVAELAAHPKGDEGELAGLFHALRIDVEWVLSEAVWRLATERYRAYARRRRGSKGGTPKRLLADFIVGAHALGPGTLLSFDQGIYKAAFPDLVILS